MRLRALLVGLLAALAVCGSAAAAGKGRLSPVDFVAPWTPYATLDNGATVGDWWRGGDYNLMVDDGSGLISSWKDERNRLAITGITTQRPTWSASGLNGHPGLQFASTTCLGTTTFTGIPSGSTAGEIIVVMSAVATGTNDQIVSYGATAGATRRQLFKNTNKLAAANDGSTGIIGPLVDLTAGAGHILEAQWTGTTENLWVDGVPSASNPTTIASLNTTSTRFRVGSANGSVCGSNVSGTIAEVLLINGTLSTADRQRLFAYFAWQYGLQTAGGGFLPSTNPYLWAPPAFTASTAEYGVILLNSAYIGPAFDLVRGSDGLRQTIKFVAGVEDTATATSFCAADALTCYVTRIYDQGGNGFDCVQATLANAPVWTATKTVGGRVPIVFNSLQFAVGPNPAVAKYCNVSNQFYWVPGNQTWVLAAQPITSLQYNVYAEARDGSWGLENAVSVATIGSEGLAAAVCNQAMQTSPAVTVLQWQASTLNCWSGNAMGAKTPLGAQSPLFGLSLGTSNIANAADMDLLAAVFQGETTAAQVASLQSSLNTSFGFTPTATSAILVQGDSFSMGRGSLLANTQYNIALPSLTAPAILFNNAASGQTLAGALSVFAAQQANYHLSGYTKVGGVLFEYVNDIRHGDDAPTIEANLQIWVAQFKAQGAQFKVAVATTPLQCDIATTPAWLSMFQTITEWIRANWNVSQASGGLGADALIDLFGDTTFGPNSYTTNPPMCTDATLSLDQRHPTDKMMGLMAPYFVTGMNAIVP